MLILEARGVCEVQNRKGEYYTHQQLQQKLDFTNGTLALNTQYCFYLQQKTHKSTDKTSPLI